MFSRKQVEENLRAKNRALEDQLKAVRKLAPELIRGVKTGLCCLMNESTEGYEVDEETRLEVEGLVERFKEILGIEE